MGCVEVSGGWIGVGIIGAVGLNAMRAGAAVTGAASDDVIGDSWTDYKRLQLQWRLLMLYDVAVKAIFCFMLVLSSERFNWNRLLRLEYTSITLCILLLCKICLN